MKLYQRYFIIITCILFVNTMLTISESNASEVKCLIHSANSVEQNQFLTGLLTELADVLQRPVSVSKTDSLAQMIVAAGENNADIIVFPYRYFDSFNQLKLPEAAFIYEFTAGSLGSRYLILENVQVQNRVVLLPDSAYEDYFTDFAFSQFGSRTVIEKTGSVNESLQRFFSNQAQYLLVAEDFYNFLTRLQNKQYQVKAETLKIPGNVFLVNRNRQKFSDSEHLEILKFFYGQRMNNSKSRFGYLPISNLSTELIEFAGLLNYNLNLNIDSVGEVLRFGMVSKVSSDISTEITKEWVNLLQKSSGRTVKTVPINDYLELRGKLAAGELDLAVLPPLSYVLLSEYLGLHNIVQVIYDHKEFYHGVIVVNRLSEYKKLSDLKGRRLGVVDPYSLSGFIYPLFQIYKTQTQPENFVSLLFTGNHVTGLKLLQDNQIEAFATVESLLNHSQVWGLNPADYRIIERSVPYPQELLVTSRTYALNNQQMLERLEQYLLSERVKQCPEFKSLSETGLTGFGPFAADLLTSLLYISEQYEFLKITKTDSPIHPSED